MTSIGYTVESHQSVAETVEKLTGELKKRGFGVLSNIDVRKVILEKLGEKLDPFVILDVCSPRDAKRAIDAHKEVGLVLPCKITVYDDHGKTKVSLYKPTEAIKVLGFSDLDPLAEEVEGRLKDSLDAIGA